MKISKPLIYIWLSLLLLSVTPAVIPQQVQWNSQSIQFIKDMKCMTSNIFHEARGEEWVGKLAVGVVTVNRKKAKGFPDSICGVVYQSRQFSWTNADARKQRYSVKTNAVDRKTWTDSKNAAYAVLSDSRGMRINGNPLFYHTHKVNPKWNSRKKLVAVIGQHKFYR